MEESRHTPGPWEWVTDGQRGKYFDGALRGQFGDAGAIYPILNIRLGEIEAATVAVHEANARLIAAAPLMLEALRRVEWLISVRGVGQCCPDCGGEEIDGHRAGCTLGGAIKAATGEPKEHAGEFVIVNKRGEFFNGDWANIRWTFLRPDARVYTRGVGEREVRKLSVEAADADLPVRLVAATGGET